MGSNDTSLDAMFAPPNPGYGHVPDHVLHRQKRDVTWDDIEEFYDDKNNFAMYLVLPIIVIVYGGCAVIYCIARCRRYLRRKKRKAAKKQQTEFMENEPLDPDVGGAAGGPISAISNSPNAGFVTRNGVSSSSDVLVGMDRDNGEETPLPWQVGAPDEKQLYSNVAPMDVVPVAAKGTIKANRQPLPTNTYTNKGFDDDFVTRQTPQLPPPYNYEAPTPPRSKPPPYNASNRKDSVEEIITLDSLPTPMTNNINSRKRRRPGSRTESLQSDETDVPLTRVVEDDEERDKARTIVRGDRPPRRDQPADRVSRRDRTPDIISHARTQPLEPRYRPPIDTQADSTNMAKQAAQLLRLDHMGKQAGKKHKRLVFVAE